VSSRSIGLAREGRIAQILTRRGELVQRAGQKVRFIGPGRFVSLQADFFGCIDIHSLRVDNAPRLIQAGTRKHISAKKRIIRKAIGRYARWNSIELWSWGVWEGDRGWMVDLLSYRPPKMVQLRWTRVGVVTTKGEQKW
jgi:hypothetical protein